LSNCDYFSFTLMKLKIFEFQLIIPFCTYRYIAHVHSQNQMLLHI
jgi:hypothetical protein